MRWGFLGASRIGETLAPAFRSAGETLTAVAARAPERAAVYARSKGFSRAEANYQSLLDAPDIDAVYISLTTDAHVPWSIKALEAGKHVLCEKPLAMNVAEAQQLVEAQRRTGGQVMEAFIHPFHPQFDFARQVIQSGQLGEVRTANAVFLSTFDREDDFRWSHTRGGGALFDLGCYCVSALHLLLGQQVSWVDAQQNMYGEVDGTTTGLLGMQQGLAATFACSLRAAPHQAMTVVGSAAMLELDRPIPSVNAPALVRVGSRLERFAPVNPYEQMVAHFSAAAQGDVSLKLTLEHSVHQAQILDALFRSAKAGQRISLPEHGPQQVGSPLPGEARGRRAP